MRKRLDEIKAKLDAIENTQKGDAPRQEKNRRICNLLVTVFDLLTDTENSVNNAEVKNKIHLLKNVVSGAKEKWGLNIPQAAKNGALNSFLKIANQRFLELEVESSTVRYTGLLRIPATDLNFVYGIERLNTNDLISMHGKLTELDITEGGHKSRIRAVMRELKRRENNGHDLSRFRQLTSGDTLTASQKGAGVKNV